MTERGSGPAVMAGKAQGRPGRPASAAAACSAGVRRWGSLYGGGGGSSDASWPTGMAAAGMVGCTKHVPARMAIEAPGRQAGGT
jgi:hypothetical protein